MFPCFSNFFCHLLGVAGFNRTLQYEKQQAYVSSSFHKDVGFHMFPDTSDATTKTTRIGFHVFGLKHVLKLTS